MKKIELETSSTLEQIKEISKKTGIPIAKFISALISTDTLATEVSEDNQIGTIEEAIFAYDCAPDGSEAREIALLKRIALCQTTDQAIDAYYSTPNNSEAEQAVLMKIFSLVNDQ